MERIRFGFTAILQERLDSTVAEPLLFPEVSSLAGHRQGIEQDLLRLVRRVLRELHPMDVHRRCRRGVARVEAVRVTFVPPPESIAWRTPIPYELPAVFWGEDNGPQLVYIPALALQVLSDDPKDLPALVAVHVLLELGRRRTVAAAGSAAVRWYPEGDALGQLLRFALVQRVRLVDLETLIRPANLIRTKTQTSGKKSRFPHLLSSATDLTAADLKTAFKVDGAVAQLAGFLTGRRQRSVLLVGKSGSGKTAILNQLVKDREIAGLADVGFWSTTGSRLVAGMSGFGMWQERCLAICRELAGSGDVLHLGPLLELAEVGRSTHNAQSIAAFLAPAIARGEIRAVAECTPEQLTVMEAELPQLIAAFVTMTVSEPDPNSVRAILSERAHELAFPLSRRVKKRKRNHLRKKRRAEAVPAFRFIGEPGLDAVLELHSRYATYSASPVRQLRFLDDLLKEGGGPRTVSVPDVVGAFSRETGIPIAMLDDEQPMDTAAVEQFFALRVLGQRSATRLAAGVLAATKTRLNRPGRPIASLMLVGPTGVGKTELAKTFAEYLFGDKSRLVRFDMSEFADPAGVARLIGGRGTSEGLLTARVREQPFAVVLLDEIEKADPGFLDLLLQVLGEARLSDSRGQVADFRNCVVILTSNIGADTFQQGEMGFGASIAGGRPPERHFVEAVRSVMRPELFNRIDRIIPFLPLDMETIRAIARRELSLIQRREGFGHVTLTLAEDVVDHLVQRGYDPRLGARPLRRAMERELLLLIARVRVRHAEKVPLLVTVGVAEQRLSCNVQIGNESAAVGLPALGEAVKAVQSLRRHVGRLARCRTVLRLRNELYALEKLNSRSLRKRPGRHRTPLWSDRPQRIRRGLDQVEAIVPLVNDLENNLLLALHGPSLATDVPAEPAAAVVELERTFREILQSILMLTYADADSITLAIHADDPETLFVLGRLYLALVKQQSWSVLACWFRRIHDAHKTQPRLWKEPLPEPARSLDTLDREVVSVVMRIKGAGVRPLFEGEAGLHVMGKPDGKDPPRCIVEIVSNSFEKYKPPGYMMRPGSIHKGNARRVYDRPKSVMHDGDPDDCDPLDTAGLLEALKRRVATAASALMES